MVELFKRMPRSPNGERPLDKSGIYRIRHLATGNYYLGSSVNMRVRWFQHRKALAAGEHSSNRLQNTWNKYGADAFIFEIVELCDSAQLFTTEQRYLDNEKPAYNMINYAGQGTRGFKWSEEAKQRASEKWHDKRVPSTGEALEAQRARAAHARKTTTFGPGFYPTHRVGMKDTPEVVEKRRLARLKTINAPGYVTPTKGKKRDPELMARIHAKQVGQKRSPEVRQKMREAQLAYNERRRAEGVKHHNAKR